VRIFVHETNFFRPKAVFISHYFVYLQRCCNKTADKNNINSNMAKKESITQTKVFDTDISVLIPDDQNFNKHTEFGMSLLEKSIRKNKFGRSVLVDKNNRIIAGNGVVETASNIGETKCRFVETYGDELVVVKRMDVDLDSQQGRELALTDNQIAHVDLAWDTEAIQRAKERFNIDAEEWGLKFAQAQQSARDMSGEIQKQYKIEIDCKTEGALQAIYDEMQERGYECRILTL